MSTRLWVVYSVLQCALWQIQATSASKYEPALAMHCGKATQHRDIDTGDWISGDIDCITGTQELLDYCKRVYPALTITNVLEEDQSVHVPTWCRVGSTPPCHGHGHSVRPFKCIVDDYVPKPVVVQDGCTFHHKIDYDNCFSQSHWRDTASKVCQAKGKVILQPQMLKACEGTDMWEGVQFQCCQKPDVAKPKASKGKNVPKSSVVTKHLDVEPICLQPKRIGLCRALLPAWHFNQDSGECEFFHYGGCGGNDNNFQSEQECISRCLPGKKVPDQSNEFCGLTAETGRCRAYFRRYHYDSSDGTCKLFVYGGCGGNKNNFIAQDDCERTCKGFKAKSTETDLQRNVPEPRILGLGPVIPDETMDMPKPAAVAARANKPTATVDEQFYTNETSIDSEHDVFADKLEKIKEEHQDKVDKVLAKWEAENPGAVSDSEGSRQQADELQLTITDIEDEYDTRMDSLNKFHMKRMDGMINKERSNTLQNFLDQLEADTPKVRHIISALEKYIEVEQKDKSHVLQHYYMAIHDDFDKESIPDFKSRMNDIDTRVGKARNVLLGYPDIMSRIQSEVDDILATVPDSPEFEESEGFSNEVIFAEEIDGGGIPDPDICTLEKVVGNCRASIGAYYFDSEENVCKFFIYGGCGKNENNFKTIEECQAACPSKPIVFSNADSDGVLTSDVVLPEEDEFDVNQPAGFDPEDEPERESILDSDVDSQFDLYGNAILDAQIGNPQPLASVGAPVKAASADSNMFIWLGLSAGVLFIVVATVLVVLRRNQTRPPTKIVVDKPRQDQEKELSPEEKQLLALQQNGYENPTYRFFEKQMA